MATDMSKIFCAIIFSLISVCSIFSETNVSSKFAEFRITPRIISKAPDGLATVRYSTGVEAELGNQISPARTFTSPTVTWDAVSGNKYCLIMFDPDVPSKDMSLPRSLKHWVVVNIPGNMVKDGQTLAVYLPPSPVPASGVHRYVFVVYLQPGQLEFNEVETLTTSTVGRVRFDVENFVRKYKLKPVAGNFFLASIA